MKGTPQKFMLKVELRGNLVLDASSFFLGMFPWYVFPRTEIVPFSPGMSPFLVLFLLVKFSLNERNSSKIHDWSSLGDAQEWPL
jgi:hypothetical protein